MVTTIRNEKRRGCGYRKQGGLYLVAGGPAGPCGKLPLSLDICPCCGQGVKPARGWTWVGGQKMFGKVRCSFGIEEGRRVEYCRDTCILDHPPQRMGLLWVGEAFYPTPEHFLEEGLSQGISRRISAIPVDFKVGQTWVLFAHRKAITVHDSSSADPAARALATPGIFSVFRPVRIEYVIRADDSEEKLAGLEARGVSLVRLVWDQDQNGNRFLEETDRPAEEDDE